MNAIIGELEKRFELTPKGDGDSEQPNKQARNCPVDSLSSISSSCSRDSHRSQDWKGNELRNLRIFSLQPPIKTHNKWTVVGCCCCRHQGVCQSLVSWNLKVAGARNGKQGLGTGDIHSEPHNDAEPHEFSGLLPNKSSSAPVNLWDAYARASVLKQMFDESRERSTLSL